MKHINFSKDNAFNFAICIKEAGLKQDPIQAEYLDPLAEMGFDTSKSVAFSLTYDGKKPSAGCRKQYLNQLLPSIEQLGIKLVLCCDSEYFKTATKMGSAEPHLGNILPCAIEGYEHISIVYGINHQQFFFNPANRSKLALSLQAIVNFSEGTYRALGENVLPNPTYPETLSEIKAQLTALLEYDSLTCDVEAFSLKHYDAGVGSISFSPDQESAVAFLCDYLPCDPYTFDWLCPKDNKFKKKTGYGTKIDNKEVKAILRWFFTEYKGTIIWHNICYDATVLIYELWMDDLLDQEGLLEGLEIMTKHFECTQLITYFATNSCAGNKLSLKEQAHAFAGNYAQEDIKDIRMIPAPILLKYNGVDTCATWYTMDKHYDTIVLDDQLEIYTDVFKPSVLDIIQMQLTGMCLDMNQVLIAEKEIAQECENALLALESDALTQAKELLRTRKWEKDFAKRKADAKFPENIKPKELDAFPLTFNPNSGPQIQVLVYEVLGMPIIQTTATKQPATGGKVLKKLYKLSNDEKAKKILKGLMDYALGAKILSSFIPAFKAAPLAPDGCHYVFGSFKLGGTVSGRLSAQNPNLQTIPSGSHFAKIIKKCFIAPPGYIMVGSDFNGLEDFINTVLTKDPNKVKVLKEGFDGHSFRAAYYWKEKFSFIDTNDPDSVIRIKLEYNTWRSMGKPVSFALQYQGTWSTLVKNCGFTEQEAKAIEANYHELYKVSMDWVNERIEKASKVGYAVGAFGLRIRTPVLAQVILGSRTTPQEAQAEARTLGNALSGQSYGLLNNTSSVRFLKRVRAHAEYRLKVRPCSHIHDAQYMYLKDDFALIAWVNKWLIHEMAWQDLPELQCEGLQIGSELDIFHPSWAEGFTIKNGMNQEEIKQVCIDEMHKRKAA